MLSDNHVRDPQRSIVHTTITEASAYIGGLGQTTYTIDPVAAIVEARFHDGKTMGGFITALANITAPAAPYARVINLTGADVPINTDPALAITHDLGYNPMVQIVDATGQIIPDTAYEIVFIDLYNVEIKSVDATGYNNVTVLLR